VEHDVRAFVGRFDHEKDPERAVGSLAASISARIVEMNARVKAEQLNPLVVGPLLDRLERAIGSLYAVTRHHKVPMRETHLEQLFDDEDQLLLDAGLQRVGRADSYYDDNLGPAKTVEGRTPDAVDVEQGLKGEGENAQPKNRDELIGTIRGFASDMAQAIDDAFTQASTIIKEPDRPKKPELVEALAEAAAQILIAGASAALGQAIGKAFDALDIEAHMGKQAAEALLDGFKEAGKEGAKKVVPVIEEHSKSAPKPAEKDSTIGGAADALSPKSIYLLHARERTSAAMSVSTKRFESYSHLLKRVPISSLEALSGAFGSTTRAQVTSNFRDLLIREWVNFGKQASASGVQVREKGLGQENPSKLDNLLEPYGVLRIGMRVDAYGAHFERAELPGVGDAVVANIRGQSGSIASLPINRRIEFLPSSDLDVSAGGFDVDPAGKIVGADVSKMNDRTKVMYANLAKHKAGGQLSDREVMAGMYAALHSLSSVSLDRISEREA
jgi:hypothetical protein